ncbi:MAG: aminopeptidase P family protein [Sphingobacteriia bacterium]|nr:aminopeptidase P family protein [Sphingobacteriia bacterium]
MYKVLKQYLKDNNIDAFAIGSSDEFLSEYAAEYAKRLKFITNFTGSAGIAIITGKLEKNAFFTDGRYTTQASLELSDDFEIYNFSELGDSVFAEWISNNIPEGGVLAFDSKLHTKKMIDCTKLRLAGKNYIFRSIENPVDKIWKDQPSQPSSNSFIQPIEYSGCEVKAKLEDILKYMRDHDADYYLLTKAESVSWLLNIRAYDLSNTPVLLSYALIDKNGVITLFTYNIERINQNILNKIHAQINVKVIDEIESYLLTNLKGKNIIFDQELSQAWFSDLLSDISNIINKKDITILKRAIKNDSEIEAIKKAHKLDAVAMITSLYDVNFKIQNGEYIDELEVGKIFFHNRNSQLEFISESFDTIAGFGSNGAIIHYRATEKSNKQIVGDNLLLIDSGGQYLCGTTDITRTILVGKAKAKWIEYYTLVLKGHINLARAKFPNKTTGHQLDVLARFHLWQCGLDYQHGTGHGVGNCLNVHEGPHSISTYANPQPLIPGMVTSNEPGVYLPGEFGIRIENLMYVKQSNNNFNSFEQLTLVPYDKRLIDFSMLEIHEKKWLNDYYDQIIEEILPLLQDELVKVWFEKEVSI